MALPWPSGMPLLSRPATTATTDGDGDPVAGLRHLARRTREVALNPTTALVAMLLGLVLLFALPLVGLPFLAVVVLPAVIYHLRAERRPRLARR